MRPALMIANGAGEGRLLTLFPPWSLEVYAPAGPDGSDRESRQESAPDCPPLALVARRAETVSDGDTCHAHDRWEFCPQMWSKDAAYIDGRWTSTRTEGAVYNSGSA